MLLTPRVDAAVVVIESETLYVWDCAIGEKREKSKRRARAQGERKGGKSCPGRGSQFMRYAVKFETRESVLGPGKRLEPGAQYSGGGSRADPISWITGLPTLSTAGALGCRALNSASRLVNGRENQCAQSLARALIEAGAAFICSPFKFC